MARIIGQPVTEQFSGAKFAQRYGLDAARGDFFISNGDLFLQDYVPDLPDDPPILEPPDPPGPTEKELLEQRLTKIEADIVDLRVR